MQKCFVHFNRIYVELCFSENIELFENLGGNKGRFVLNNVLYDLAVLLFFTDFDYPINT
jgi:hypothetical protein